MGQSCPLLGMIGKFREKFQKWVGPFSWTLRADGVGEVPHEDSQPSAHGFPHEASDPLANGKYR